MPKGHVHRAEPRAWSPPECDKATCTNDAEIVAALGDDDELTKYRRYCERHWTVVSRHASYVGRYNGGHG